MDKENLLLAELKIDGRPLHRYRICEELFDDLQLSLMQELRYRNYMGAAPSFVLWASEYYRREFQGGAFSWYFLTEPLCTSIEQSELRQMTVSGLKYFCRKPYIKTDGVTQYLRALAAEGGIPVHLLSKEGGYRQALLGLVSDLDRFGAGCPYDEAMAFASKRALKLPLGYRTDEYCELFVEFAREISGLRQQAPDELERNDIESWLDDTRPGWREKLVLRLDKGAARSLLSHALAQSMSIGKINAPILRQLKKAKGVGWVGHVSIADSSTVPCHLLQFELPTQERFRVEGIGKLAEVCPNLMLSIEAENDRRQWSCKRISGRLSAEFNFPLDTELEFVAMAHGKYLGQVELPGGAAIRTNQMPSLWLMAETGEDGFPIRLEHAGNANLKTVDNHIWVHVPEGFPFNLGDGVEAEKAETALCGTLWRVSGKGRLSSRDWNAAIETRAENTDRDELVVYGKLNSSIRDRNGLPVYRGLPNLLFRKADRSFHSPSPQSIRYRPQGTKIWRRRVSEKQFLGTLEIAVEEDGGIGARVTAKIMPDFCKVTIGLDNSITFHEFPADWLVRVDEGDPVTINDGGETKIPISADAWQKERLSLILTPPDKREILDWWLVLQRGRSDFANLNGEILKQDKTIAIESLPRWKFVASGTEQLSLDKLDMSILPRNPSLVSPTIAFDVPATMPLSGFRTIFESLLALESADAELRLQAICGVEHSPRLFVRRYLQEATIAEDKLFVKNDRFLEEIAGNLVISAIDLDAPKSQKELTASENSNLSSRLGPGRWFLVPKIDNLPLRPPPPIFTPIDGTQVENAGLKASPRMVSAYGHFRREERIKAFSALLENPGESDFQVLETTIDWLLNQGVSPAFLDSMHALTSRPQSAVLLLLRCRFDCLFNRLSLEFHGSPRWDFISPESWGAAFDSHIARVREELAAIPALADDALGQAKETLRRRLREILSLRPDLTGHVALGLLDAKICGYGEIAEWLGNLPPSFGQPEKFMEDFANETVKRHVASGLVFPELLAKSSPRLFSEVNVNLRGLIEAPLFVAEIAFGQRSPPTFKQRVQLLHARYLDSGIFEEALPAAMAWKKLQIVSSGA